MIKYPIYKPHFTGKEKEYVNECIDSTWISSRGKFVDRFEKEVAAFSGSRYGLGVFNGTVALHLVLQGLGIGKGDEVIVPDFTYIASANAVLYTGANLVLCDVDEETWNAQIENIEPLISEKTKAIMVTDIYGNPCEYERLISLAKKYDVFLIVDSAESLGATVQGKRVGSFDVISTYSFFGNKTITTGEGGFVNCNDEKLYQKMAQLKNQGNSPTVRYFHDVMGFNYRMTNIQAAIGCAQMTAIDFIIQRKQEIADLYKELLGDLVTFQKVKDACTSSNWMIGMLFKNESDKQKVITHLESVGIETRPFFKPVHTMPYIEPSQNPVTTDLSSRGINVPSYPDLKDQEIKIITKEIKKALNE